MDDGASLLVAGREALAAAYLRTGDYDGVDRILERARRVAEAEGDPKVEAGVVAQQGMLLHFRAIDLPAEERASIDPGPEEELFERALAARRELEDTEGVAESLFQLGLVHQVLRRDMTAGAPYFRDALALIETVPDADPLLRSEIHRHVGFDLLLREERPDAALLQLRASLDLRTALEERGWTVSALVALALAERLGGRRADAMSHSRAALELARAEGLRERFVTAAEDSLAAAEQMPEEHSS
jgi:tetratricopeptide (TPR) repeat protein